MADSIRIWPPVFLWGREMGELSGGSASLFHWVSFFRLQAPLASLTGFHFQTAAAASPIPLILPVSEQGEKWLHAPRVGRSMTFLGPVRTGHRATRMADRKRAAEVQRESLGLSKPALPSLGHGDQDWPPGLQQLLTTWTQSALFWYRVRRTKVSY